MTESILVADSEDDCAETLRRMESAGIGHMPVLAEGHVLSMVSIRDLLGTEQGRAAASRFKGVAEI